MLTLAIPIFNHAHPINFRWALIFLSASVSACKRSVYSICSFFRYRQLHDWLHLFLNMPTHKIVNHLLICVNLYHHVKYHLIPSVHSWGRPNFRVQGPNLFNLLWRNSSFQNHAIWLAESVLGYILGARSCQM